MKTFFRLFILLFSLNLLSGCASNHFKNKYLPIDYTGLSVLTCETPKISLLPDLPTEEEMLKDGFILIGTAKWEGPAYDAAPNALEQGQEIKACLVLWSETYRRTETGTRTVTTTPPGRTSTTNVYDSSGKRVGYTTTYTPGIAQTQLVPYSRAIYGFSSMFFAKVKK